MTDYPLDEEAIFKIAAEIPSEETRSDYLRQACGSDRVLLDRVMMLLRAHEKAPDFLESPPPGIGVTEMRSPLTEKPGTVVGPYKLLQQIGEGGFGVVYMAEQTEPVRRKVALKIIKPGMDTKEVIARFEAERQALALMDHPNIAKVLDAGATESGRPYFVMELIKGVPLTEYCDKNQLPARDRLHLFVFVCQAIQHAHQKGVIHRDLKPSNIMVTLHDGKPVPKVIDFGVSKALSQQLTEKTLFTAYGQMVGTPAYMSPEQAEMSGLDVDTRSDVYSLGVLLYELLTGTTPFDAARLRTAGYAEMQRIIREEEPIKPSTRVTTLGEESTVVSKNRGTDPKKLGQLVRGDLDWIVMKALDKERNRRYETPNGIAADIERFLEDEPVEACPPSAAYRFRKFARRNKGPMVVTTAAVLALVVVAIGSTIAAGRFRSLAGAAEDARDREQQQRQEAERQTEIARQQTVRAEDALTDAEAQRERAQANFALARSAVDEFLNHVADNELLTVPGLQPLRQELLSSAMEFYEDFTRDDANAEELLIELARAHYRLAVIHGELGTTEESTAANERSIKLFDQLQDGGNDSLEVRLGLARSYFRAGRYEETVTLCRDILDAHPEDAETRSLLANTYNVLAIADKNDGDIASALAYHQQAFPLRQSLVNEFPENPAYLAELGSTVNNIGVLLARQGRTREALARFQTAVGYSAEAYSHAPQTIQWGRWLCIGLRNVAYKQASFGEQDAALRSFENAVDIRRSLAFENPAVPSLKGELYKAWVDLGNYQRDLDLFDEANRSFRAAEEVLVNIPRETPAQRFDLAIVYGALATPAEGIADSPDEADIAEQQRYADLAMITLSEAVAAGYQNVNTLQTHQYLGVLHERNEFQQLVTEIEAQQLAAREGDTDEETLDTRRRAAGVLRNLIGSEPAEIRHQRTLADVLHSIGVLETGEKQFDQAQQSLREADKLREALCEQDPDDPELLLELYSTQIALGDLDWARGEFEAAHARWQQYFAESVEFLAVNSDSSVFREGRLAAEEQTIYDRYAQVALWPLLLEFADRTVRYEREYRYGIRDYWFLQGVLAADDRDTTERLLRRLAGAIQDAYQSDATTKNSYSALIRAAAIADLQIISSEQALRFAEEAVEENGTQWGACLTLAVVQYRAGEYSAALGTIRPFRDQYPTFLEAAIAHRLGDHEGAIRLWTQAEDRYQLLCSNLLRSAPPEDATIKLTGWKHSWHVIATLQALRREAYHVVHGGEADDPWQHLIQARGYRLIGETEHSEAELAAAEAAGGNDPEILLARARLFAQRDDVGRAEADWQRAIELAGDDPRPWVERGRWYAERGEQDQAEADFAHAATLTPHELNRFLEAGWWVIGPYPENLAEFCPPELDPDPSRPERTIDPQNGVSDEPSQWLDVPTGAYGVVDLSGVPRGENGSSVYALSQVYSPDERSMLLMIDRDQELRVWVNGALAAEYAPRPETRPIYEQSFRLPITLRAGGNTILIKSASPKITVRLGDSPRDRVILLAEQRRCSEAAELLAELKVPLEDYRSGQLPWRMAGLLAMTDGSLGEYERTCAEFMRLDNSDRNRMIQISIVCAQHPNSTMDEYAEQLVSCAEERAATWGDRWGYAGLKYAARVNYRAGNYERAQALLDQIDGGEILEFSLRALLAFQSGDASTAAELLDNAFAAGTDLTDRLRAWDRSIPPTPISFRRVWWYYQWIDFVNWLSSAEQTIRGTTAASDELRQTVETEMARKWTGDPQLVAYDHALLLTARDRQTAVSCRELFVARGRRLAELGRLDEAETDFNKAVELAPDDVEVLIARGVYFADNGQPIRAAADFDAALNQFDDPDKPRWMWGSTIDLEAAERDDVYQQLITLRPEDHYLRVARVCVLVRNGDLDGAQTCAEDLTRFAQTPVRATVAILNGDHDEYERLCATADDDSEDLFRTILWGLAPNSRTDSAELLEAARRLEQQSPEDGYARLWIALAETRGNNAQEAVQRLESPLPNRFVTERVLSAPILAIAHHQLGDDEVAREWLAKSRIFMDWYSRDSEPDASRVLGLDRLMAWDWLYARVLHDEAERLIEGDPEGVANELAATPEVESQASKSDAPNPGSP